MEVSNIQYNSSVPSFNGTKQVQKIASKALPTEGEKIFGQDSCWRLHKPEVLEQFIKSDQELSDILSETMELARKYGFKISIGVLQKFKKNET